MISVCFVPPLISSFVALRLLEFYKEEMLPMESLDEAMDVLGLLGDVPDVNGHLQSLLDPLPS